MKLSEKIVYCRKQGGMSQEALAERLSVSRQAVSKWETGDAEPGLDKLRALADAFGVTADWLLSDEEPPCPAEAVPVGTAPAGSPAPAASSATPEEWLDAIPGFLGRMLRRYGWLYGVYVALSGLGITVLGIVAKVISNGMMRSFSNMGSMTGMGGFESSTMMWFDEAGNQIADPFGGSVQVGGGDMFNPVSALATVFIVVGVALMIGGVALALWMRHRQEKK